MMRDPGRRPAPPSRAPVDTAAAWVHAGAMRWLAPILAALAAACGPLPRDPENTLDRVRAERAFRVGLVAGRAGSAGDRVVAAVARATGARPVAREGQLEPLLLALEAGRLDLVVGGRFDPDTPWATRVALGTPLDRRDADGTQAFVAARNGENAWIILVDRAAKRVSTAP